MLFSSKKALLLNFLGFCCHLCWFNQGDMKPPDVALCRELHPSIDLGCRCNPPKCYCHSFLSLKLNSVMGLTTTSNQYISRWNIHACAFLFYKNGLGYIFEDFFSQTSLVASVLSVLYVPFFVCPHAVLQFRVLSFMSVHLTKSVHFLKKLSFQIHSHDNNAFKLWTTALQSIHT
jgi:hypothetical protein